MKMQGVLLLTLVLLGPACSGDTLRRTGYETVQNVAERQCRQDLTRECPERQSYDEYRREQNAVQP